MKNTLKKLIDFTSRCRPDMHEPDEQEISARIVGDHLDNAMGNRIIEEAVRKGFQEYVVVLHDGFGETCEINLATLIALARKADVFTSKSLQR